jgi:hypothetical protein
VKSSLKQPSSRIPRIGIKPYARRTVVAATELNDKEGGSGIRRVMRKVDLTQVADANKTVLVHFSFSF